MNGDVMSGGVVVAIAAILWLAYLVPVWLRRREYLATERNAVRLQQTLRILAETSELPDEVRLETNARSVAEQQKVLRRSEQKVLAQARAAAQARARRDEARAAQERAAAEEEERAAQQAIAIERAARAAAASRARALSAPRATGRGNSRISDRQSRATGAAPAARGVTAAAEQSVSAATALLSRRRQRVRRARSLSTMVLLLATISLLTGMLVPGAGALLLVGGILAVASVSLLVRLAQPVSAPVVVRTVVKPRAQALYDDATHETAQSAARAHRVHREPWTPQPLPKPLHLSRGTIAASAMASIDAATELRRAAAQSELERKAAELVPAAAPTPLRRAVPDVPGAPERAAAASAKAEHNRYAAMGNVDGLTDSTFNLDDVLRRRRAAS